MQVRKKPPDLKHPIVLIHLAHNRFVLVDSADYQLVSAYHWQLKRSNCKLYAMAKFTRDGKTHYIRMHRLIMNTPTGQECHHIFGNTLDNRRSQLENLDPTTHRQTTKTTKQIGDTYKADLSYSNQPNCTLQP